MIDAQCNALSRSDELHRISSLEIDLGRLGIKRDSNGTINIHKLSQLVERKLKKVLAKELQTTIRKTRAVPHPVHGKTQAQPEAELVAHYLQKGTFPWWAKRKSKAALKAQVNKLIKAQPDKAREIFRKALKSDQARQRMLSTFTEEQLFKTMRLLSPGEHRFIKSYIQDLQKILSHQKHLWTAILFPFAENEKTIKRVAFVRATLLSLAAYEKTAFSRFINDLLNRAEKMEKAGNIFKSKLPELLRDLRPSTEKSAAPSREQSAFIKKLSRFLEDGLKQKLSDHLRKMLRNWLSQLEKEASAGIPHQVKKELEILLSRQVDAAVSKYIRSLLDASDKTTEDYLNQSYILANQMLSGALRKKALALLEQNRGSFEKWLHELLDEQLPVSFQSRLEDLLRSVTAPPPKEKVLTLELEDTFHDSEALYVDNAGLVLFWPFLKRFLEHLHLLDEGQFKSRAAAHRATLFLQYLADGTTETAEHMLALNKVLCGLPLLEPFEGETLLNLTEEEQATCEEFINMITGRVPRMEKLSVAAFRRAWLQREGVLSMRENRWMLQVQKKTHDIILDKLPWSIGVVRLPWMDALMVVDW